MNIKIKIFKHEWVNLMASMRALIDRKNMIKSSQNPMRACWHHASIIVMINIVVIPSNKAKQSMSTA